MTSWDIPISYHGLRIADSAGNISFSIFGVRSDLTPVVSSKDFKVLSCHLRTQSASKAGSVSFVAQNAGISGCGGESIVSVIDKIYLPNQTKSDSLDKDMYFCSNGRSVKKLLLIADGLSEDEEVFYEILITFAK